jgi:hypothetical protein
MDDIVRAALAKWPHVPHCHGWLALDTRGDWYMRDERIQRAGPFPQVKGSRIVHDKLLGFIHRNYACDEHGAWFFQNGPQRVYVQLQSTPHVWRLQWRGDTLAVHSHTGAPAQVQHTLLDEAGHLYAATPLGLGLVHTADMAEAARAVECGLWQPTEVDAATLPARYGYVMEPVPTSPVSPATARDAASRQSPGP